MSWPWVSCHRFSLCVCSCQSLLIGFFCCSEFMVDTNWPAWFSLSEARRFLVSTFLCKFSVFIVNPSCSWTFLYGQL